MTYDGSTGTTATTTPSTTQTATSAADLPEVGDIVDFGGTKQFRSSNGTTSYACKPGKAKVTSIAKNAKHPIHIIALTGGGSNAYGWVDAADIATNSGAGYVVYTVVKGDTLWGIAQKRLGNGSRYKEIMTLNGLKTSTIRVGQTLKLPNG